MIKKIGILTLLALLSFGCGIGGGTATGEDTGSGAEEAKAEESGEIKDGDLVVAKWSTTSFYEGKASDIRDDKINVAWSDGSSAKDVDRSDVYQIPKTGAKPDVKVGDIVLAKISTSSYWNGAEVKEINGEVYVVQGVGSSSTTNLDGNKIIKISPAVAANFQKRADSSNFTKTASSKSPEAPRNFSPKKGDKVLAVWAASSWYQGTVDKVAGDKITVAWEDASKPSEVSKDKVIPMPNASNTKMPEADQYVLTKPKAGSRWSFGQVTEVSGDKATVKDANGNTQEYKKGEVVPLS